MITPGVLERDYSIYVQIRHLSRISAWLFRGQWLAFRKDLIKREVVNVRVKLNLYLLYNSYS